MAVRKDGIESSCRLLKVACEVFAERGYRKTTIGEICRRAECNVASVNYYFGSKDELYAAVWKNAFEEGLRVYPAYGGLGEDAAAEERLGAMVKSALHRILDSGRLGYSGQILLREMSEPSGVMDEIIPSVVRPLAEGLFGIVQELLGPKAGRDEMELCAMSVIHQFLAIGFKRSRGKLPPFFEELEITDELIERLSGHIKFFSLAGIAAVRAKIENN